MKTAAFARSFWFALLPTAAVLLFCLHLSWKHEYRKLPPRIGAPIWAKSYVAFYDLDDNHGNIDYYLFHTGILGFGARIQQADLLLFGTSHVQFGLSAGQLGQKLSVAEGHPVKVFNLALASSVLSTIGDIVAANHLHDKPAVFDLFVLDNPAHNVAANFMLGALSSNDLDAYVQVGKCWTEFWRDWLLDGLLPNLRIGNPARHGKTIIFKRFLKFTAIRDSTNGDVIALWVPTGLVYPKSNQPGRPIDNSFQPYASLPNGGVGRHLQNNILQAQHIHAIYTLLPFDGSNLGTVPADAQPFIPISPNGLVTWDGSHLLGESRTLATERLFEGMEKLGIHIGPSTPP